LTIKEAIVLNELSISHPVFAVKGKKNKSLYYPALLEHKIKRIDLDVYVKKL
jgi:hypothetical protein